MRRVKTKVAESARVETNKDSQANSAINIPLSAPITFLMPISLPRALAHAVTKLISQTAVGIRKSSGYPLWPEALSPIAFWYGLVLLLYILELIHQAFL